MSTLVARLGSARSAANAIRAVRDRLLDLQKRLQATAPEQLRAIAGQALHELRPGLYHGYESLVLASAGPLDSAALSPEQWLDAVVNQRPGRDAGADEHLRYAVCAVLLLLRHFELSIECAAVTSGSRARKRARKMDRARMFLASVCTLARLAVKHADLAVAFLAGFSTQARQELPAGRTPAAALVAAKRAAAAIHAERGRLLQLQTAPSEVARTVVRDLRPGLELGYRCLTACFALAPTASAGLSLDVDQFDQLHGNFDALVAWLPSPAADAGEHLCLAITALRLLLDRCAMLLDRGSGMNKASTYLDRVSALARLAVTHSDLAVAFLVGSNACARSQTAPLASSSSALDRINLY